MKPFDTEQWQEFVQWATQEQCLSMLDGRTISSRGWDIIDSVTYSPRQLHETQITTQVRYYLRLNSHNFWRWEYEKRRIAEEYRDV